ncbi:MAG TPA: flavodoxin family protein [Candidatus Gallacutalibacter stercoravium]|nr:flavodoxin family protein [Candidatus Gallacutalibacter stercoravium]
MRLVISDIPLRGVLPENEDDQAFRYVDLSALSIANCTGCFGCWVKTPGKCVIRDDATKVYPLIAQSDRLIYVSRICYGSYDTVMKTMLERAIPIQQAFIRLYQGETHHEQRDVVEKDAVVIAYGADSEEEQEVFRRLVERNARNMLWKNWAIRFVRRDQVEEQVMKEVQAWKNCSL